MNIAFIIARYWPAIGGAESLARQLVRCLKKKHQVRVITSLACERNDDLRASIIDSPTDHFYYDGATRVDILGAPLLHKSLLAMTLPCVGKITGMGWLQRYLAFSSAYSKLRSYQGWPEASIALYHGKNEHLYLAACALAKKWNIPFILQPLSHQTPHWKSPALISLYRSSTAVICLTESEREWLVEHGASRKLVHIIPPAAILPTPRASFDLREYLGISGSIVLFLGGKRKEKGYLALLESFPEVLSRFPEAHLLFIGPDTEESAKEFKAKQHPQIHNLGVVEDDLKLAALKACDILCVPSCDESLGLVYLEAWHYAKPVIACSIPCTRELFDRAKGGILVNQAPKEIADAIVMLLQNDSLRHEFGKAGHDLATNNYNWAFTEEKLLELVKSCRHSSGAINQDPQ